jgi:hypothetical protein
MSGQTKRKAVANDASKGKKELPSEPNAKTIAAIREARRGPLKRYRSVKALLKSLNADD